VIGLGRGRNIGRAPTRSLWVAARRRIFGNPFGIASVFTVSATWRRILATLCNERIAHEEYPLKQGRILL
jgi:hypothetical protein